ncbi:endolytic transglycosylase MltG [Enemella sp. A6]|uniref:endolytic transglycosylase MltG n=1 Tax=Enemella sp. A6 TaxID=3440152 RepID=UPI003EC07926
MLDPQQDSKRRERIAGLKSALAVLVALGVLVGGGYFAYNTVTGWWDGFTTGAEDYPGPGGDPVDVTIPEGANLSTIGAILKDADVVRSVDAFTAAAAANDESTKIQPGKFTLRKQIPASVAVEMLLDPANRSYSKVTIREGLRLDDQIEVLAAATGASEEDFRKALADPASYKLTEMAGGKPEGFLFPNTYEFDPDDPVLPLLTKMATQFDSVAQNIDFGAIAEDMNIKGYDVVTIASIIEAEVNKPEYRAMVARVIYNRLEKGMPLQMDSTVHYAVGKSGGVTTTDQDRANKSPYNTYVHKGLPPGPINAPGEAALKAAAEPDEGDWLYFVTVNLDTGETKFAETMEEHEKNVAEFQAWCQANKGRC